MRLLNHRRESDSYTETEAAQLLGISVDRLHKLLDENVFNDGSRRPSDLRLQETDLILLEFWNRSTENPKVVRMPNRR
jgi:alpha-D-ribose 1-methylphosphonate 5-triphosphate synthase subunit PhnI